MMKKKSISRFNFTLSLIIVLIIFLKFGFAHAESLNPEEAIQKEIGVNPDDLPKSPEELQAKYLTQNWEELVDKNKVLGPVHRFLKSFFLIKILFGQPYSLSVTFLIVFILWFIVGAKLGAILEASGITKGLIASAIGFLISVILAQVKVYSAIAEFAVSLFLRESSWWVRLIIALAYIIILAILIFLAQSVQNILKQKRKAKKEERQERTRREIEAFSNELKKK